MAEEPLFTITKDHLESGMRGFPVGYCTTSFVDPQKGLFYLQTPIADLAYRDPLEVIHLLYTGKEGSPQELELFKRELHKRSACKKEVIAAVQRLPKEGHPMKLF